jgi:hypothetical protein
MVTRKENKLNTGRETFYNIGGRSMNMEQRWNDTDIGKLKYWERNIIRRVW